MLDLTEREWRAFSFEDLFFVRRGESVYKQYMNKGAYPYISATAMNNGISDYIDRYNRDSHSISLAYDGSIGSTFYQGTKWFASEKIVSIELKDRAMNRYIGLFLCQVIAHQKSKYSYGYKWSVGIRMMRGKILLPTNSDGTPDYDFMEEYIKEREKVMRETYIEFAKQKIHPTQHKGR